MVADLHGVGGLGISAGALAENAVLQAGRRGGERLRCVGVELAGTGRKLRVRYFSSFSGHGSLHGEKSECEREGKQREEYEAGQTHRVDS